MSTLAGNSHFSHFANILAIQSKPDLNAEDLAVIIVGDVLNDQERHDHAPALHGYTAPL